MQAEYPAPLAVPVAEALLRKPPCSCQAKKKTNLDGRRIFATMPYLHGISDNIKTVGARVNISIVLMASNQDSKLSKSSNPDTHKDAWLH